MANNNPFDDLDNRLLAHAEVEELFSSVERPKEEKVTGYKDFFSGTPSLEGKPAPRKQRARTRAPKAVDPTLQKLIEKQKKRTEMEKRLETKLANSVAYGVGVPGEGIVPQSVHGMELGPNEWGEPAVGIDRDKFLGSLDKDEKKYMLNLMKNEGAFKKPGGVNG